MEDFVVKYFVYLVCMAGAVWSFCMFLGMLANCMRMKRKHIAPGDKLAAFMTKCKIETLIYFIIPFICVAVAYFIHVKYNT